ADIKVYVVGHEEDSYGDKFRFPFQSEAEYNAAIGLTNTPLELIKIQDFQYLMPESQVIVDKSLSPDSDNVIANSAVAKALDLKADKTALETLSLEVDSKANTVDVDAISEQVNAKANKTEVQSIAQALGNKADSSALVSHTGDTENPHKVTKEQIGLSKVENKSSSDVLSELNFVGENMLENSTFHSNFSGWTFTHNASSEITQKDGMFCGHFSGVIGESTSLRQSVLDDIDKDNLDQLYTFSADIRLDGYVAGTTNPFAQIYFSATYDNNGTNTSFNATTVSGNPNCVLYNNQGWKRIYWTVKFSRVPNSLYAFVYARDFTGDLYFKNLKLEKGSVPTAYTLSVADYTGLLDRVSALEATLLSLGGET
ncbi:MAG: hypothetical protein IKT78_03465, partial [Ruminiclostridium sp.]|nr:hypothetical protein [Ruminiclostridium sp.]